LHPVRGLSAVTGRRLAVPAYELLSSTEIVGREAMERIPRARRQGGAWNRAERASRKPRRHPEAPTTGGVHQPPVGVIQKEEPLKLRPRRHPIDARRGRSAPDVTARRYRRLSVTRSISRFQRVSDGRHHARPESVRAWAVAARAQMGPRMRIWTTRPDNVSRHPSRPDRVGRRYFLRPRLASIAAPTARPRPTPSPMLWKAAPRAVPMQRPLAIPVPRCDSRASCAAGSSGCEGVVIAPP